VSILHKDNSLRFSAPPSRNSGGEKIELGASQAAPNAQSMLPHRTKIAIGASAGAPKFLSVVYRSFGRRRSHSTRMFGGGPRLLPIERISMMRAGPMSSGPHRSPVRYRGGAGGGGQLACLRVRRDRREKRQHSAEANRGDLFEHNSVPLMACRLVQHDNDIVRGDRGGCRVLGLRQSNLGLSCPHGARDRPVESSCLSSLRTHSRASQQKCLRSSLLNICIRSLSCS